MASAAWMLTRGLESFRGYVNVRFPHRDKKSDGTIGDQTHASGTSGHNPDITGKAEYKDGDSLNEVRAWDMDSDLNDQYGYTAEKLVQYLVTMAREGRYIPFRYIIYKRRIWRRANSWKTEQYTGASAHEEHVHFSGDYTDKADNYTGNLGIPTLGIPAPKPAESDTLATSQSEFNNLIKNADVVPRYSGGVQVPTTDSNPTVGVAWVLGDLLGTSQRTEKKIADLSAVVAAQEQTISEMRQGIQTLLDRSLPTS